MELPFELPAERVNFPKEQKIIDDIAQEVQDTPLMKKLSIQEIFEKVELILLDKIKNGDKKAYFQIGLLYYEQGMYDKARTYFQRSKDFDFQSLYQYSVMLYDGLGGEAQFTEAVECMKQLSDSTSHLAQHLLPAVRYNIGRAYFQGYGVRRADESIAERWWLMAADDGNPKASIKAQSTLGMFYSRTDTLDLKKAFFWHSEACGNGSLESQGALGVMYEYGVGVKKDYDAAYICLKDASERGNIYAMGNLVSHYFRRKIFTKAVDLASKVAVLDDVNLLAEKTDCLPNYIRKGISIACFFYARCLAAGIGLKANWQLAQEFYSRCYNFDPDACVKLQRDANEALI